MAIGEVLHLWNQWGIQILVLTSFVLQVFLLVVGGIRRRSSSTFLSIVLWFAYLLADSTAIYTLGHLSIATKSREHHLVAFWAPFLLLHLGGPDNITAYALEDNRLWLRHLQTLIVQVLGAAYVTYRYMARGQTLLLLSSISMFIAGLLKYGERTWALKSGNFNNIRGNINYRKEKDICRQTEQDMSEEEILLLAHSYFDICMSAFTDFPVFYSVPRKSDVKCVMNQYKLIEIEMSLMYDVLYTKEAVIHTWYGFSTHFISLLATATAFLLFQLSTVHKRNGYSTVDMIISYILLVGALVLEATSLCRALLSSWTRFLLHQSDNKWERLFNVLTLLGRRVQPASRRLWVRSIGQYNLFELCTRDRNMLVSRLAMKVGMEESWKKMSFSGTVSFNNSLSTKAFMELVFQAVPALDPFLSMVKDWDPRGRSILKKRRVLTSLDPMHFGVDFNESILIWHIATEMYIHKSKAENEQEVSGQEEMLVEATGVLSNYLMFLMVKKPEMFPDPRPQDAHVDICRHLESLSSSLSCADEQVQKAYLHGSWNPYYMLKEVFHRGCPNKSRIQQRKELAFKLSNSKDFEVCKEMRSLYGAATLQEKACKIVAELLKREDRSDTLEIILAVWVELLLYAGERCSRNSHARHLSKGGEFITILWLMMHYHTVAFGA